MSSNTESIVQEIRTEFESMLNYVKESKTATADQVERGIFKRLLELGFRLMLLFFTLRAEAYPRTPVETDTGEKLPYFDDKKRGYYSIFGKLPFWRPYFYAQGVAGQSPLDAALSLGSDCYSDLVREIAEYLGVDVTYEKVTGMFARILGQKLSTNAVSQMVAEDAADVEAYYPQDYLFANKSQLPSQRMKARYWSSRLTAKACRWCARPLGRPKCVWVRETSAPRKRKRLSLVSTPLSRTLVLPKR
jgi:hypothetical protein